MEQERERERVRERERERERKREKPWNLVREFISNSYLSSLSELLMYYCYSVFVPLKATAQEDCVGSCPNEYYSIS